MVTLLTPQWHFPEDPSWLGPFQSGSCSATSGGCPQPVLVPPQSSPCLTTTSSSLSQHQCTALSLLQLSLGLIASHTRGLPCTPARQQQLKSNQPASGGHPVHQCLHTSVPTTVVSRPHSQPGQGPALPASVSVAVVAQPQQEAIQVHTGNKHL